jgi:hypothetical protein
VTWIRTARVLAHIHKQTARDAALKEIPLEVYGEGIDRSCVGVDVCMCVDKCAAGHLDTLPAAPRPARMGDGRDGMGI